MPASCEEGLLNEEDAPYPMSPRATGPISAKDGAQTCSDYVSQLAPLRYILVFSFLSVLPLCLSVTASSP